MATHPPKLLVRAPDKISQATGRLSALLVICCNLQMCKCARIVPLDGMVGSNNLCRHVTLQIVTCPCALQVKVFWPAMGRWYIGRVSAFDSKTGRHTVQFKDGDKREYVLRHEAVVWLDVPGQTRLSGAAKPELGWQGDEVSAAL